MKICHKIGKVQKLNFFGNAEIYEKDINKGRKIKVNMGCLAAKKRKPEEDWRNFRVSVTVTQNNKSGESEVYRHYLAKDGLINYSNPHLYTMQSIVLHAKEHTPHRKAIGGRESKGGKYSFYTYEQSFNLACDIASGMLKFGLLTQISDRDYTMQAYGVYSKNRVEYILLDMAAMLYGFTVVPLYDTLGMSSVQYILSETGLKTVFVANENLEKLINEKTIENIKTIVNFEESSPQSVS